jgi:hypothetical protein
MAHKNFCKVAARALQDILKREGKTRFSYTECLRLSREHAGDVGRPKTAEEYAAWLFERLGALWGA